jgi:hypothetical protein
MLRRRFPPSRFPELNLKPVLPPPIPSPATEMFGSQATPVRTHIGCNMHLVVVCILSLNVFVHVNVDCCCCSWRYPIAFAVKSSYRRWWTQGTSFYNNQRIHRSHRYNVSTTTCSAYTVRRTVFPNCPSRAKVSVQEWDIESTTISLYALHGGTYSNYWILPFTNSNHAENIHKRCTTWGTYPNYNVYF